MALCLLRLSGASTTQVTLRPQRRIYLIDTNNGSPSEPALSTEPANLDLVYRFSRVTPSMNMTLEGEEAITSLKREMSGLLEENTRLRVGAGWRVTALKARLASA